MQQSLMFIIHVQLYEGSRWIADKWPSSHKNKVHMFKWNSTGVTFNKQYTCVLPQCRWQLIYDEVDRPHWEGWGTKQRHPIRIHLQGDMNLWFGILLRGPSEMAPIKNLPVKLPILHVRHSFILATGMQRLILLHIFQTICQENSSLKLNS